MYNDASQGLKMEDLIRAHIGLLRAVKIKCRYFPKNITDRRIKSIIESIAEYKVINIARSKFGKTKVSFTTPNYVARAAAVKMALKLGGGALYPPATRNMLKNKSGHLSDAELEDLIKRIKRFLSNDI